MAKQQNLLKLYLFGEQSIPPSGEWSGRARSLATTSAIIVVPTIGRDTYTGTASAGAASAAVSSHAREDFRAAAVDSVRLTDNNTSAARQTRATPDSGQKPQPDSWSPTAYSEPQKTIPFLAQLLGQQSTVAEDDGDGEPMPPSVRLTARQAYMTARESTVQFLSPTPLYDLFV